MAGAGYKSFTAGSVLTASDVNTYLMQQAVMTFANEAARDAAISAPSEGMVSYITTPTVPAATGTATMIPSGIKTIYNGSKWVCVTPVGAATPTTGTTTAGSYSTALTSGGTNPSVTLSTGTTALISIGAQMFNSGANLCMMSVEVTGATTLSASDNHYVGSTGTAGFAMGRTFILTGLTAGDNTFHLTYKVVTGTGSFGYRTIVAQGIA